MQIPEGWSLSEKGEIYHFSREYIPDSVKEQARGMETFVYTDPQTGTTYEKSGGRWRVSSKAASVKREKDTDFIFDTIDKQYNESVAKRDKLGAEFVNLVEKINKGFILKRLFNRIRFGGKIRKLREKYYQSIDETDSIEAEWERIFEFRQKVSKLKPELLKDPHAFNEEYRKGDFVKNLEATQRKEYEDKLNSGILPSNPEHSKKDYQFIEKTLKNDGVQDTQRYINRYEEILGNIMNNDDTQIFIAIDEEGIRSVLESGSYKNMFERNNSRNASGTQAPDIYTKARMDVEENLMGIPPSAEPSTRPKYGYVGSRRDISTFANEHHDIGGNYGHARIELRSDIKKRASVTNGDSLDSGDFAPSPMSSPKMTSFVGRGFEGGIVDDPDDIEDISYLRGFDYYPYIEAQIYGNVTTSDISAIHIPSYRKLAPSDDIIKMAKGKGIEVYHGGKRIA